MTPLTDVLSNGPRLTAETSLQNGIPGQDRAANSTPSGERIQADSAERSTRSDRDRLARELQRDQPEDQGQRRTAVTARHDDVLETLAFELRDAETDELLRQVPPDEVLEAARVNRVLGVVLNQRI